MCDLEKCHAISSNLDLMEDREIKKTLYYLQFINPSSHNLFSIRLVEMVKYLSNEKI